MDQNIEQLKLREQVLRETADWWQKEVQAAETKLNSLLSSPDENYDEILVVRGQLSSLRKKSFSEQEEIKRHEENKDSLLKAYLYSGCASIDLSYYR